MSAVLVCAHYYHRLRVSHCLSPGLVGEAGQYSLPDGEWFCVQCTSIIAEQPQQQQIVNETLFEAKRVEMVTENVVSGSMNFSLF